MVSNLFIAPSKDELRTFIVAPITFVTPTPATIDLTLSPNDSHAPKAFFIVEVMFLSVADNIASTLKLSAIVIPPSFVLL